MKTLILVIGRSGSGKDTVVRYAQKIFNASSVPSYTDRMKRPTETEGIEHTFLSKDEFDSVLKNEKVFAYTQIGDNGYRYCTTVEMLNKIEGDTIFYIIDPDGYDYCKKYATEFNMVVAYVYADANLRKERANIRNGDDESWEKRSEDEDKQFNDFERAQLWDICIENNDSPEVAQERFVEELKRFC